MFSRVLTAADVVRHQGIENSVLRLANRLEISSLEEYILYERWGFERDTPEFDVKTVNIDPAAVTYTQHFPFDTEGENGVVGEGGGPWYRCVQRFDETQIFESMRQRFVDGRDWNTTEMYQTAVQRLENGERAWNGCTSLNEVEQRCAFIDNVYEDIKSNGFLSQAELRTRPDDVPHPTVASDVNGPEQSYYPKDEPYYYLKVNGVRFPDELRIACGPDGQLIRVGGGRHRLAIAKLLEIEEMPAVVQIQHEQFHPTALSTSRLSRGREHREAPQPAKRTRSDEG